ncbi:hypothetical protein LPJ59_000711 [Coemansia sp. RSA 2399]|nr:hypothetical protein LPJ59_000711 [Coemansia sp. RSA 2399]KAJ1907721.1 hypothetical protein LPJ81_000574 [Coemansia sp. IMI 209127]
MSSAETLAVLSNLSKRKISKRERKSRSKQFASTCVRRSSGSSSSNANSNKSQARVTMEEEEKQPRAKKSDADVNRERNIVALHAADKLISKKCKDMHKDIIELLRAQKEQRQPKIRKPKLSYFDFEDDSD